MKNKYELVIDDFKLEYGKYIGEANFHYQILIYNKSKTCLFYQTRFVSELSEEQCQGFLKWFIQEEIASKQQYAEKRAKAWDEFIKAAREMLKYCHPHQRIICQHDSIEIVSGDEVVRGDIE